MKDRKVIFGDVYPGEMVYYYPKDMFVPINTVTDYCNGGCQELGIEVKGKTMYFDEYGCERFSDKNPTLFWDKPKLEIPKKPFNLKSEYKKLQRKEFVYGETNCIISLDSDYGEISWDWDYYEYRQEIGVCYYQKESIQDFIDILNDNKVTFDELEKVVKEVEDEDRRD